MKKNIKKLLFLILLTLILVSSLKVVMAVPSASQLVSKPTPTAPTGNLDIVGKIIGGVQAFGMVMAVVAVIIIGMMYVMAAPEGKLKIKEKIVPFMIGVLFTLLTTTIVKIFYDVFSKVQ